jgi:hypothetical protein
MPGGSQLVSKLIENAFGAARSGYGELDKSWTLLSHQLGNLASIPTAMGSIQRAGTLDLLIRCLEDDLALRLQAQQKQNEPDFAFHYQKMFSELWVVSSYEILRALRQREQEAGVENGRSASEHFVSLFIDLERLRMPLEKHEITKEKGLKKRIEFTRYPKFEDSSDPIFYDRSDPHRTHIMPMSVSSSGSVMWLAFHHAANQEYWIERRQLADRFLLLGSLGIQ